MVAYIDYSFIYLFDSFVFSFKYYVQFENLTDVSATCSIIVKLYGCMKFNAFVYIFIFDAVVYVSLM